MCQKHNNTGWFTVCGHFHIFRLRFDAEYDVVCYSSRLNHPVIAWWTSCYSLSIGLHRYFWQNGISSTYALQLFDARTYELLVSDRVVDFIIKFEICQRKDIWTVFFSFNHASIKCALHGKFAFQALCCSPRNTHVPKVSLRTPKWNW